MSGVEAPAVRPYDEPLRAERPPFLWLAEREVLRFLNIWQYSIAGPVLSTILFVVVFGLSIGASCRPDRRRSLRPVHRPRPVRPGDPQRRILQRDNESVRGPPRQVHQRCLRQSAAMVGNQRGPRDRWDRPRSYRRCRCPGDQCAARPTAAWPGPLVFVFGTLGVLVVAAQTGVIAGSLAKSLDHVYAMESIVLLPLGFLGGIFYSVRQLPHVWDVVSQINPVFWLVQVERIGLVGSGDVSAVSALAVVWGLAVALSVWSAVIFGSGRLKA